MEVSFLEYFAFSFVGYETFNKPDKLRRSRAFPDESFGEPGWQFRTTRILQTANS
jgi:hypothetical protein